MDSKTIGELLSHTPTYVVNNMDLDTLKTLLVNGAEYPGSLGKVRLDWLVSKKWGVCIVEATESPVCCVMHIQVCFPKEQVKEAVMAFIDRCNLSTDVSTMSSVTYPHLTGKKEDPDTSCNGGMVIDHNQILEKAYTAYLDLLTQASKYTGKAPLPIARCSATSLEEVRDYLLKLLGLMHDHHSLLTGNKINSQDTIDGQVLELLKCIELVNR